MRYRNAERFVRADDLGYVIDRENAAIGDFITLEKPSKDMITEPVGTSFYDSPGWNKDYPKLQILTIEELLSGNNVELPPNMTTFKQAEKIGSPTDGYEALVSTENDG